jgi:hypothetical protein
MCYASRAAGSIEASLSSDRAGSMRWVWRFRLKRATSLALFGPSPDFDLTEGFVKSYEARNAGEPIKAVPCFCAPLAVTLILSAALPPALFRR